MKRSEFTARIAQLLAEMVEAGEKPLLDYVKRSDDEQHALFERGLSKLDGFNKVSRHQRGCAADIYFPNEDGTGLTEPIKGFKYWHDRWVELGGRREISWDRGHYEG